MPPIISIENVTKSYASGLQALKPINLEIEKGEIFALLGPNGAGKTTLINIICGIVTLSSGRVTADGHDVVSDYRAARAKIGLVPQELTTDAFETVWATVTFSRGLFGRAPNPDYVARLLRDLSLSDKRGSKIMELSGGMKRRVMIAKALSHEPDILFLDEPTAGVDVELRRDMWNLVRGLRARGVTIILTTHYIEEAEEAANWRPSGWQLIASDEQKLLYVLMQPEAKEGTHKDPASEVWVYDAAGKARVKRLRLERPGSSIALTHGTAPLLLVQADDRLDVYDPQSGSLVRSQELPAFRSTRMQIEPVR